MSKPRLWIGLSFLLVFAAGIVAGIFGHNWFAAKRTSGRGPSFGRGAIMDFWSKEIGLDAAQLARLREIFKANDDRMRTDARLKEMRGETSKRYGELRQQLQSEIDAVLTPSQKTKLEETLKRYAERRRRSTPANRRDQPPAPNPGRSGRSGAPDGGPDAPEKRNLRTEVRPPFHEYLPKGVNE